MFTDEFLEEQGFTTEQVDALKNQASTITDDYTAKITDYETRLSEKDKQVSIDIDKSLDKIANKHSEKYGIAREKGEKNDQFIDRLYGAIISKGHDEVNALKVDLTKDKDESIKALTDKLTQSNLTINELKGLEKYKTDYESLSEEVNRMKLNSVLDRHKPTMNTEDKDYADYKWNSYKSSVNEKFEVKVINGEDVLVDRENPEIVVKLSDNVKESSILSSLMVEKTKGLGSTQATKSVANIPFKVPKGASKDGNIRLRIIQDFLIEKHGGAGSNEYAKDFADFNQKIIESNI